MKKVTIIRSPFCIYCRFAESLLNNKHIEVEKIDVFNNPALRAEWQEKTGHTTIPMIFIGDDFIGGYNELALLDKQGKLEQMLQE